jgi:hypothetical protein
MEMNLNSITDHVFSERRNGNIKDSITILLSLKEFFKLKQELRFVDTFDYSLKLINDVNTFEKDVRLNLDGVTVTVKLDYSHMEFTTLRPKESGYYFVKWSPEEKPLKIFLRYYSPVFSPKEEWTWAKNQSDDIEEDIEIDVDEPELIQFSNKIFNVPNFN